MSKYSKFSAFTTANARMKSSIYIFILTIHLVNGFLPRTPPPGHWQTKTHFDITNTGILQAVSEYIFETKNTSATSPSFALNAFFGTDYNGMARMFETVRHVRTAVADTQENKRNIGYVHCNADQIKLGIKGKQLMTIASPEEDTCKDVPNIDKDCTDNMLVQNKLTSGFHHGRGNVKPPRSRGSKTGKCSHGGPADTSRRLPAKCGINKDTTVERLSPHYHLHNDAYLAAVAATKYFLIDKDSGILQHLGNETFDLLFHIKQRRKVSLAFAVDYSGSMGREIAAVKEKIIQIVTSTLGSENEPANYVLSLFSDPAIELSLVDSTIIVFTDADAKDANRINEIQTAATFKHIKVTTLRSGLCGRRMRNSANRYQRDTNFFESVAATTGGTVYDTTKEDIGNVLDEVIEDLFPTSEVILEYFTWNREDNQTRAVYVDKSIHVLKIVIKGASRKDEIDFLYPNGTKETFSTPTASRIFTDKNDLIMSIQKLSPGMYNLLRPNIVHIDYEVNITAQSSIEVDGETVEENQNGSSISVEGSPIVGNSTSNKYTYILTLINFGNGTCSELSILDPHGKVLMSYEPTGTFSDIDTLCSAKIIVPNTAFQVKVTAVDESNAIIIRTVPSVIRPTSVELMITSYRDDIALDKENEVSYSVINSGTNKEMYNVRLHDDKSFALEPLIHYHTLNAGDQANGSFILFPKNDIGVLTYQVMVELNKTLERRQTITKRVSVTKTERPVCEVVYLMGKCEIPSLNTANCSKYNWYAESNLYFRGTLIESISSSGGSAVHLEYQNLTDITEGPLKINISGVCCTPYITIDATDVDGFMSRCILDLSNGLEVESVDPVEDVILIPSTPTNTNKSYVVIGAVSGCVIFLCIVILIGVITKTYFGRMDKKKKYCITSRNGPKNKPIRNVQNISFSFHNRLEKFKDNDNDSYSQCY
ncbi:unnamed protein product [Mytilus edulis]|uniref:VWFA domain-containing protein n=1 Tax=Mytilus edulis TaxID=6550 RepID=A0A8S3R0E1_MYTED|nr:unnamed protein product [Mytilus edulis]